jgi:Tfp pilus assembly protein PilX
MFLFSFKNKQNGQVLLITVLVLMSTFALSIALGGMVLYELRAMVNTNESVKALYAAESGIEWQLFKANKGNTDMPVMTNNTTYENDSGVGYIRSSGNSGRVNRAIEVSF